MATLDETLSQQQREHLKAIQSAGQRSAELTGQLLTFARRQHLQPEIRFVFMSGYAKNSPSDLWPPGKMAPVLQKPFDLQQLALAVNSAARLTAFM